MALGPYASAEEKALYVINEKLDFILAIVNRKTPEDYTRIAREEADKAIAEFVALHGSLTNISVAPELPAIIAPTFLSGFTLEPNLEGSESAKAFLDELPDSNSVSFPTEPLIVPAVIDNAERVDDDGLPF